MPTPSAEWYREQPAAKRRAISARVVVSNRRRVDAAVARAECVCGAALADRRDDKGKAKQCRPCLDDAARRSRESRGQ